MKRFKDLMEAKKEYHVLKGHPYHYKSDAELHYIIKDAHEAEKNAADMNDMKGVHKYADQRCDASTVLGYRQRGGQRIPEPKAVHEETKNISSFNATAAERRRVPHSIDRHRKFLTTTPTGSGVAKSDPFKAQLKMRSMKEELTPREKMSGAERLAVKKPVPVDRTENLKKNVTGAQNVTAKARKTQSVHKTVLPPVTMEGYEESGEPNRGREMHFSSHVEHSYHGGEEAKRQRDAMAAHLKAQGHKVKKSKIANQVLHGTYGHVYRASYVPSSLEEQFDSVTSEKVSESGSDERYAPSYKIGDKVRAKIGPHKGQTHTVIHVHSTGHVNITPDVNVAHNKYRQGTVKAHPHDVEPIKESLEEASSKRSFYTDKQERDPSRWKKNRFKLFKRHETEAPKTGINRKTVQEAFQAAKDKKAGKTDNLPQSGEGAHEPGKEKFDAPAPQPQDGAAPLKTQDGGAPGAQKKGDNYPKPEAAKKSDKITVKGPGADDKFQPEPYVTPLTTMPDTASPKSGGQGVR